MFLPFTAEYHIVFDATVYVGIVWPFAEFLGGLAAVIIGLLSLWFTNGKLHWFLRASPILLLTWMTLWIPAYDLGMVALVQFATVSLGGIGRIRSRQFGLTDLLLFVVFFAAIVAFLVRVPNEVWHKWHAILWFGVGFGLLTLLASRIGSREGKWGWRWVFVVILPYVGLVTSWLYLGRSFGLNEKRTTFKSVSLWLLSLLIVSPVVVAFTSLLYRSPIPKDALPAKENCLPALCDAGNLLPETLFRPFPQSSAALESAVLISETVVRDARSAMRDPGWISVDYGLKSRDVSEFENRAPQRDPLVQLWNAFLAEGKLAATEGRIEDALKSYKDILRMAECSGRGGLPFDASLAAEFEASALERVNSNRESMTVQQCQDWISHLQEQEAVFEPSDVLRRRRQAWVDRIASWQDRLVLRYLKSIGISRRDLELELLETLRPLRIRMVITQLALHAHRLDHGDYPDNLESLVPDYLNSVPHDPFSESTLVYRRSSNDYELYSIGPDGKDDGGVFPSGGSAWYTPGDFTQEILKN